MSIHAAISMGHYKVRCFGPDGVLKWEDGFDNIVVDEGLEYLLKAGLSNEVSAVALWYVGLLNTGASPAAGWTAASLAAVDFVDYDEDPLPTWAAGSVASKSVSNTTPADFTINAPGTIAGAYVISTNVKATPGGTLYSAGTFDGGDKPVGIGDTLQVTATFTEAAA